MKKVYHILVIMMVSFAIWGQTDINIEMVSFTPFPEGGNDVWGYVDEAGIEYAIVGSRNFTRIYSLEDPAQPQEIALIQGASSLWRDFKTYGKYVYVTTDEGSDGLTIIDMSNAPESVSSTLWKPTLTNGANTQVMRTCHNLYIDENGIAYLAGCNFQEGVIIVDVATDPLNPTILGYEDNAYAHDVYVQRDTMYTSDIYEGVFSVYDVSDKANPVYLGGTETTSIFTHNAWTSDDGRTLFTTDEVANAYVDSYDISDLSNIKRLDRYQPTTTANQGVIPHNTHFINDYLVTSWYTDGIVITDVSDPDNMVKVGGYDTFIGPNGDFNGCWGAYPWLPSGLILASNITNGAGDNTGGLYVLNPTYKRAAQLRGRVTDIETTDPINMASVTIMSDTPERTTSDPSGAYKTGIAETGVFDVMVSHPDYVSKTISVFFSNGVTEILNVQLDSKVAATINGSVVRSADGSVVPEANIFIFNEENNFIGKADADGIFNVELFVGEYTLIASAWGHLQSVQQISIEPTNDLVIELEAGYQDDFIFDLDWSVTGDAQTGAWELGTPRGTIYQGQTSNPSNDDENDFGQDAYVTGNGGGNAGNDDVDAGTTILTSPIMDLSNYTSPHFHFSYWFFNEGGNSTPDDNLVITVNNGTETVEIFSESNSQSSWNRIDNMSLDGLIELTDNMTIAVTTSDFAGAGHLVECGFDAFLVSDGMLSDSNDPIISNPMVISPNPFDTEINVNWTQSTQAVAILFDNTGRMIEQFKIQPGNNRLEPQAKISSGVYHLKVMTQDGNYDIQKLIKI